MQPRNKYSGMFSDMPGKGWGYLIAALLAFTVHAVVARQIKSNFAAASNAMTAVYAVSIFLAFLFLFFFAYQAWKTTEKRRKQIENSQAIRDGLEQTEDYRR